MEEYNELRQFHKIELSVICLETIQGLHRQDKCLSFAADETARAIVTMETGGDRRYVPPKRKRPLP